MQIVTVMSRTEAIRYCYKTHSLSSIMISISDPSEMNAKAPFKTTQNGIKSILRLYFEDKERGDGTMTREDAVSIRNFVEAFPDAQQIIVHCGAGISRSAGVAAAILKRFTGSDERIFQNPRYCPNMHVYRMLLNEFYESESN